MKRATYSTGYSNSDDKSEFDAVYIIIISRWVNCTSMNFTETKEECNNPGYPNNLRVLLNHATMQTLHKPMHLDIIKYVICISSMKQWQITQERKTGISAQCLRACMVRRVWTIKTTDDNETVTVTSKYRRHIQWLKSVTSLTCKSPVVSEVTLIHIFIYTCISILLFGLKLFLPSKILMN